MTRPVDHALEKALNRVFAGDRHSQASWFALSGGETLFSAGDEAETLYLVRSGRLGVFRRDDESDEETFVGIVRPGEPAGEMALLAGTAHTATVVALRDTEVLALPRDAFLRAARSEPEIMVELSRLMIARAREKSIGAANPSVFGFVSMRDTPIRPMVDRIARLIEATGRTVQILDATALDSAVTWLSRQEESHDFVLYVAESDEPVWAGLCTRQVDRLFAVVNGTDPARTDDTLRAPALREHRRLDLIVTWDGRQWPPQGTARWLDALEPARWFHVRTGVEQDEARIARVITGRSIGLVLSGGGARAYAHIGAVRALRDEGVPFDFIAAVSMGAVVGSCIALEWPQDQMEARIHEAFVQSNPLSDIAFPYVALTRGHKVERLLVDHFGEVDLADVPVPLAIVSSNLTSIRFRTHRRGRLRDALRASISLPGVLPPVIDGDAVLVDGAVLKNFPADIMRAWHLGPIIGVDVSRARGVEPEALQPPPSWLKWLWSGEWMRGPPIVSILMRSATVPTAADLIASRRATDLLILPRLTGVEIRNWKAWDQAVQAGAEAARAALANLKGSIFDLRASPDDPAATPEDLSAERSGTVSETAEGSDHPGGGEMPPPAAHATPTDRPRAWTRRKAPSDTA